MENKSYRKTKEKLYRSILIITWVAISFYSLFYLYTGAWLSALTLGIGVFLFTPLVWLLNRKGYKSASGILLIASCSLYVLVGNLGLSLQGDLQYYYLCVAIGSFLVFDLEDLGKLVICVSLPILTWFGSEFIPQGMIPSSMKVESVNIPFIELVSHIGSSVVAISIMIVFVTQVKKLNDKLVRENNISRKRNNQLLRTEEYANIGSWSLDLDTQALTWSEETFRIHELANTETPDVSTAINYYHPDDRARISDYVEKLIEDKTPYDDEFRFITAKGNRKWVRAIGFPILDDFNELVGLEGCFQDITQKKEVEMAKEEFLALISHEMRTPLMAVIGFSDMLKTTRLDEEQSSMVASIHSGGETLVSLINDILDVSKIKNSKLQLKPEVFDLDKTIKDCHKFLSHSAEKKGLEFSLGLDILNSMVIADPNRIGQILTNLLSNSIKFTDDGFVRLEVTEKDNFFEFSVKDSGSGMSKDFIPRIFEAFEQDMDNAKFAKGTGLGMYISKSLVDMMEGDIQISSELEVGTTIKFTLPLKRANSQRPTPSILGDFDFNGATILYADDTPMNQMVVKRYLQASNCQLLLVSNGKEAVEVCSREKVDIVLMDLQMPVMDGYTATELILSTNPTIPVLAFSAFANSSSQDKAYACGCVDTVSKPIRKNEFLTKLLSQLDKSAAKSA